MFPLGLNITIVSYLFYAPDFMPTRPYCGPALELGVQRLRDVYGFNATLQYVGHPAIKNVPDIVANVYRVADFYYNKWDRNGVFAMIVPGWNSILIPSGGYFNILRNRTLYPTTFGTAIMQYSVLVEVFTAILNNYGWKSICIIKDVSTIAPFYNIWIKSAQTSGFVDLAGIPMTLRHYSIDTKNLTTESIDFVLTESAKYSRVFIVSMTEGYVRRILVRAAKLGFKTDEFAYLILEPFELKRFWGDPNWKDDTDSENNDVAFTQFRNLLQVSACKPRTKPDDLDVFYSNLTVMSAMEYGLYYPPGEKPHAIVMANYDAVEIFGQIINETLSDGADPTDGQTVVKRVMNRTFPLTYSRVYIDDFGERRNNFCVSDINLKTRQYSDNSHLFTTSHKQDATVVKMESECALHSYYVTAHSFDQLIAVIQEVMLYDSGSRILRFLNNSIDWATPTGAAPPNEPRCGYLGNRDTPDCRPPKDISLPVGVALAAVVLYIGYKTTMYLWKRMHDELHSSEWYKIQVQFFSNLMCHRPQSRLAIYNRAVRNSTATFATDRTRKVGVVPFALDGAQAACKIPTIKLQLP